MGGWAASRMLDLQMAKAVAGDFSGGGSGIGKFLDVIGLVPGLLASARMPSELFSVVETVFRSTVNDGHADDSFAALVTHYDPGGAAG
jgi:3-hydroxyisobutyrate dehydrogenase-like beta-hydroxyacid dehydrogenase